MKALLVALLLLSPMGASARPSDEQCVLIAQTVFWAAQGRDMGSSPSSLYQGMMAANVPSEIAENIVNTVFSRPDMPPADIAMLTFNLCTSEAV